MVTPYYNPNNNDNTGQFETVDGKCYTLWLFDNDITNLHSSVSATTDDPSPNEALWGRFNKEKAVDGYTCDLYDGHMYHSVDDPQNFLEIHFPTHVRVTGVLVKTRVAGFISFFANMEVRVGNYSGLGNVGLNTKIGNTVTSIVENELVRYDATSNPVVGKYVIIRQVAASGALYDHLIIQEMKVIGHVV